MNINRFALLNAIALALLSPAFISCDKEDSNVQWWDWTYSEPAPEPEPEFIESNPAITALGWENVKETYGALPKGINVYKAPSTLEDRKAVAYAAVVDLTQKKWDVWSVMTNDYKTNEEFKTPSQIYDSNDKPAVLVNAGFFYSHKGNYSQSLAVKGGEVYCWNINYASQDWVTVYNQTAAAFIEHADGSFEACWTYSNWNHSENWFYSMPAPNAWGKTPCETPSATYPVEAKVFEAKTAIGGGPVLLRSGEIKNTYPEELLGISADSAQPRTAIGVTADKKVVLFVCEGRGMTEGVSGFTTEEVAKILKTLGCVEAMNLDGGGSSCMLVNGQETIKGSDGTQRAVASAVMFK
ncbi:MAG: phosphodiester glycosidase family protein [Breznakibacter sp.]